MSISNIRVTDCLKASTKMYKLIGLFALVACAMAEPKAGLLVAAPAKLIATAPLASSYSNSYQKIESTPILKNAHLAAPAIALPAHLTYAAAPLTAAHLAAPIAAAPIAPVAAW